MVLYNLAVLLAESGAAQAVEQAKQALQAAGQSSHEEVTHLPLVLLALLLSVRCAGKHVYQQQRCKCLLERMS